MTELATPRRVNIKSTHSFKIKGSVFELRHTTIIKKGIWQEVLYKRYFVSSEFVELFYKIHDGGFESYLFDRLSGNEKQTMSTVLTFLNIDNKEFNIALSKTMRTMFEKFKLIEGAIKAGNLSTELHDEYVDIMRTLAKLGLIPRATASQHCNAIGRTLKDHQANRRSNL